MKKIISLLLTALVLLSLIIGTSSFNVLADATVIDETYVQNKINTLKKLFPTGSYFTTTGTNSCSKNVVYGNNYSYCYSSSCPTCKLENVLKYNTTAKNTIVPSVYKSGSRYSCCGFAAFAFCYIFEHDPSVDTTTISSGSGGITTDYLSKLKIGDLIRCYTSTTSSTPAHYAIFLGYDDNYIYLYESNYDSPNQVEYYHKRARNGSTIAEKWNKFIAYRSNNYTSEASAPVNDIYKLTAPDGYQTVRSSTSTGSSAVTTIPTGTYVTVTKYNADKSWGYITYNGKSGWIYLYYVEAHNHTYGSWTTTKAATCTTSGTQKRTCACGKSETKTISATGHSYSSQWTTVSAATCTSSGTQKRTCACGNSETQTIAALGHNYENFYTIDKPATCTVTGSQSRHCARCSSKTDYISITPQGHEWSEWKTVTAATTTNDGLSQRSCSNCTATEQKNILRLAQDGHTHSFSQPIVKNPTCEADGSIESTCTICKQKEITQQTATGHSFGNWEITIAATQNTEGEMSRKCANCDKTEKQELPKLESPIQSTDDTIANIDENKADENQTPDTTRLEILPIIIISAILLIAVATIIVLLILLKKKKA